MADAKSPDLYNNLGYVQTLNKQWDNAAANLDRAAKLAPENPIIPAAADKILDDALDAVSTRGPYFRDEFYFANLRSDEADFTAAGQTGPAVRAFFLRGREAEASIGALGRISPGTTHGARLTGLILRKSNTKLGQIADFVTIGCTYHDLRIGDHISLRFYANGLTYNLTASLPDTLVQSNSTLVGSGVEAPDSHFRLGLTNKGEMTMEVYLNGVSQGEVSITI